MARPPEHIPLPRARPSRWTRGDVVTIGVALAGALAGGAAATLSLAELEALKERLLREPSAEEIDSGRLWGGATLDGRGLCRVEA